MISHYQEIELPGRNTVLLEQSITFNSDGALHQPKPVNPNNPVVNDEDGWTQPTQPGKSSLKGVVK